MKKILVAVDDTKGSQQAVEVLKNLLGDCYGCGCTPETIVLVYVKKPEGRSVMSDLLLSDSEMATLQESLKGTEYQAQMDQRAELVLSHFKDLFEKQGFPGIKLLAVQGHPAEEILKVAQEEGVEMIVIGSRGKRLHNLWMGSISREVANNAEMSVLIAR
jgi:nucleotide-binding universal stress UspA family protein